MSVRELHRAAGVSLSTVRRLLSMADAGNVATWLLLADALDVDIAEFFDRRG